LALSDTTRVYSPPAADAGSWNAPAPTPRIVLPSGEHQFAVLVLQLGLAAQLEAADPWRIVYRLAVLAAEFEVQLQVDVRRLEAEPLQGQRAEVDRLAGRYSGRSVIR